MKLFDKFYPDCDVINLQIIVKISLNKPLMSDSLSRELCPMKLNIVKSKNNPNTPGRTTARCITDLY